MPACILAVQEWVNGNVRPEYVVDATSFEEALQSIIGEVYSFSSQADRKVVLNNGRFSFELVPFSESNDD